VLLIGTATEGELPAKLAEGHPGKVNLLEYVTLKRP
jgi:hypothetical protein